MHTNKPDVLGSRKVDYEQCLTYFSLPLQLDNLYGHSASTENPRKKRLLAG